MIRPSVSLWCPCRAPCSSEDRRPCSHLAPPPAASPAPSRSCRHSPGQSLTEPGRNESGRRGRFSGPLLVFQMRAGRVLLLLALLSEGSLPLSLLPSVRSAAADFPSANGIYRPLDEGPIRELGCCTEALEEEEGER